MICIKAQIPDYLNNIDDELKAIIIVRIQYVSGFLKAPVKEMSLLKRQKVRQIKIIIMKSNMSSFIKFLLHRLFFSLCYFQLRN